MNTFSEDILTIILLIIILSIPSAIVAYLVCWDKHKRDTSHEEVLKSVDKMVGA